MIYIEKHIEKLELLFKILILFYTILSWNAISYGTCIISIVMWPMIALGIVLLGVRIRNYGEFIKNYNIKWLALLAISFLVSTMINIRYELKNNMILFVFWLFYFFILYSNSEKKKTDFFKQELKVIGNIFVVYMAIGVGIALIMFAMHISKVIEPITGNKIVIGFVWGRLWGVFLEPNIAAIMAIVTFYLSLYLGKISRNIYLKFFYYFNMVQQIFFVAFSDSRTASVCLGISAGLYTFIKIQENSTRNKNIKKSLKSIFFACAMLILGVALPNIITEGYNYIISLNIEENEEEKEDLKVERGYDMSQDYTNRRGDIWKSGLEIFMENKIFGTSYYGIRPYALENMPNTYIIDNDFAELRNLHNEFLNILVSQGVVGAIIILIIWILYLKFLIVNWKFIKEENKFVCKILVATIVALGGSSMLVSAGMFFYNAPSTIIFWILLGYLVGIISRDVRSVEYGQCD